jgi:predicted nucleotidyltransferase
MTSKYPKRIQSLLDHLRRHRPEQIYLFGSWARGEEDELSDVDLVMVMESDEPFLERSVNVMKLLPTNLGSVDLLVYTPEEFHQMLLDGNAFVEMLVEEGRIVYGRSAEN